MAAPGAEEPRDKEGKVGLGLLDMSGDVKLKDAGCVDIGEDDNDCAVDDAGAEEVFVGEGDGGESVK